MVEIGHLEIERYKKRREKRSCLARKEEKNEVHIL
jgi:hypothetical protein